MASICLFFMGFSLNKTLGYKEELIGEWEMVYQTVYLTDTTFSDTLSTGSCVFHFMKNDSVDITLMDVDTTVSSIGWYLNDPSEDTVYFSEGTFMCLSNKTPTSFNAVYPLDVNSAEYIQAKFSKLP